jgi:flavin reductase (DIM6/NTAB) family NADH-FMN oxidoreductase RutF
MEHIELRDFWKLLRPEVVSWAVAEHDGRRSICPLGWTMRTSGSPPMMAISVAPARFTHGLIEAAGAFALAYPGRELAQVTLDLGTRSGADGDKFADAGLTARPALHVAAPLVEECVANLECRLVDRFTTGDHTIFVGEVLAAWARPVPGPLLCLVDDASGYETLLEDHRYRFGVVRR